MKAFERFPRLPYIVFGIILGVVMALAFVSGDAGAPEKEFVRLVDETRYVDDIIVPCPDGVLTGRECRVIIQGR